MCCGCLAASVASRIHNALAQELMLRCRHAAASQGSNGVLIAPAAELCDEHRAVPWALRDVQVNLEGSLTIRTAIKFVCAEALSAPQKVGCRDHFSLQVPGMGNGGRPEKDELARNYKIALLC